MNHISVIEAANLLGRSPQFVRIGLQRGKLPFGIALDMSGNGRRHRYEIFPEALKRFIKENYGRDVTI